MECVREGKLKRDERVKGKWGRERGILSLKIRYNYMFISIHDFFK